MGFCRGPGLTTAGRRQGKRPPPQNHLTMDEPIFPLRWDCDAMAIAKAHLDEPTAARPSLTVPCTAVLRLTLLSGWEPLDVSSWTGWSAGVGWLGGGRLAYGTVNAAGDWPGRDPTEGEVAVSVVLGQAVVDGLTGRPGILWVQLNAVVAGSVRTVALVPMDMEAE